jgi:Cu(I)/Ag(I) efflux system membrane fusion protein
MEEGSAKRLSGVLVGIAVGAALIAFLGLAQHLRHGWPFSLHHDMPGPSAPVEHAPAPAHSKSPDHPRTEVRLAAGQAETFGIQIDVARVETIARTIHAVATVVPDESRISHVHTRVSGWVERLHVNTTGQQVRKGQALAGIFSQDLLLAQSEYLLALKANPSSKTLIEAARNRLEVFGLTDRQIAALARRKKPEQTVTIVAPRSGVVFERGISVGTAVDPSTRLMSVVDLSVVWVIAEIPEPDIPDVKEESIATLSFPTAREPFEAKVDYVYPTLTERTRTLQVRFVVDNEDGKLRPGSYGSATFQTEPREGLTVPRDAVVDTGVAEHVFVATGEHRFEPRTVVTGVRVGGLIEIREGLEAGEAVVSSGVFLIDSESRLRASGSGGGHAHGSMATTEAQTDPHAGHGSAP